MAFTLNPFDLLVDNDTDDLSELVKVSVVVDKKAAQKQSPPAAVAVPAKSAAKLPSKPLPPSQAVREARSDGGHGGGHGGREYGERNGVFNGYSGGVYNRPSEDGKPVERRGGYGGPRGSFRSGRGGGVGVCDGVDGERPRRVFERRSGTGRGNDFKRDGAGRGNWGIQDDETTVAKEETLAEKAKTGDEVKICAACAMDWSIELDKGLRSRKPCAAVDAIRRIGPRLEKWGREPA